MKFLQEFGNNVWEILRFLFFLCLCLVMVTVLIVSLLCPLEWICDDWHSAWISVRITCFLLYMIVWFSLVRMGYKRVVDKKWFHRLLQLL